MTIYSLIFKCSYFVFFCLGFTHILVSQNNFYIYKNKGDKLYARNGKNKVLLTSLNSGNTYFFKRGQVYNTKLVFIESDTGKIRIDAFGNGVNPLFSLYTILNSKKFFLFHNHVWMYDLSNVKELYKGKCPFNFNIGFLNIDKHLYGGLKQSQDSLLLEGDFCIIDNILYLKFKKNPLKCKVKIAFQRNGLDLVNNLHIENITLEGAGGHGIQGINKRDIVIKNVLIREIGGSYLPGYASGFVRYGNGVEFWNGCLNCVVENCRIEQVYDSALTIQGNANNMIFDNIVFKNNILLNNEQAFEFWTKGNGVIIRNCKFKNNSCINSGMGWSHIVRPDKNVGVHILSYMLQAQVKSIEISGNRFYKAKDGLISLYAYENSFIFDAKDNIVYEKEIPFIRVNSIILDKNNVNHQLKVLLKGFILN